MSSLCPVRSSLSPESHLRSHSSSVEMNVQLQFSQAGRQQEVNLFVSVDLTSVQSESSTHHDDGVSDGGVVDRPGGHQTGHGQGTAAP